MIRLLKRTFLHLPHIGERRERWLWKLGIASWNELLLRMDSLSFPPHLRTRIEQCLIESMQALRTLDASYFERRLPPREHWRAYEEFKGCVQCLDIETTGLFPSGSYITVVGLYDGRRVRQFVRGENLDELPHALEGCRLLLTFNGRRFDVPFLLSEIPELEMQCMHADLLHLTRRLGIKGGLKSVEAQLGIARPEEVQGLDGYDAVRLWRQHERGVDGALERLLEYNAQDVINLQRIMDVLYERACKKTMEG